MQMNHRSQELKGEETWWTTLCGSLCSFNGVLQFFIQTRVMLLRTSGVFFQSTDVYFHLRFQQADGCKHAPKTPSHSTAPLGLFPLSFQTFSCFIGVTKYLHKAEVILAAVNKELCICSICQAVCFCSCAAGRVCTHIASRIGGEQAISSQPSQTVFLTNYG